MSKRAAENTLKTPQAKTQALLALILVAALASGALTGCAQATGPDSPRAEAGGLTLAGTEAGEAYTARVYPNPETGIGGFADWAAATAEERLSSAGEGTAEGTEAVIRLAAPDGTGVSGTGVSGTGVSDTSVFTGTGVFIVVVTAGDGTDGETRYATAAFTEGAASLDWAAMGEPPLDLRLDIEGGLVFPDTVIEADGGQPPPTLPDPPAALTATLTNADTRPTGPLTVSIGDNADGDGASDTSVFVLLSDAEIGMEAGETADITVRPVSGLDAGTYAATVRVSRPDEDAAQLSFAVSYRVVNGDEDEADEAEAEEALTRSISLNVAGSHRFTAMTEGEGIGAAPLIVVVTNTGTEETGRLAVTLSGTGGGASANDFVLSGTEIAGIPAGGRAEFSVVPKTELAAGTRTATITVGSDTVGSASASAVEPRSFSVIVAVAASGAEECSVSFDPRGGNQTPPVQTVKEGLTATAPAGLTKAGLHFRGWYLDIADARPFDFASPVTANIMLYAVWEARVSFDANGGGNAPAPVAVDEGGTPAEPPAPSRANYSFAGWFRDAQGATRWEFGTDTAASDITLYAKWTRHTFRVTFSTNMEPVPAPVDVPLAVSVPRPSLAKAGYTMDGWYSAAGGQWDFAYDTLTDDITLHGYWRLSINVSFVEHEGQSSQTAVPQGTPVKRPVDPARTGYVFADWYAAGADAPYNFDSPVSATLTLEARWTPLSYTVRFDTGGVEPVPAAVPGVPHGATLGAPAPVKAGYTMDGWYRTEAGTGKWAFSTDTVTADTRLYGFWTPLSYTVRFDTGGVEPVPAAVPGVPHGATLGAPAPVKAGHYLDGWYTEADGTEAWDFAAGTVTRDMTLYGHWKSNVHTVTFTCNGGTPASLAPQTVQHGATLAPLAAVTKPNLILRGWKKADGTMFSLDAPVMDDLALTAVWEAVVAYNLNGGTINGSANYPNFAVADGLGYAAIPSPAPVKSGGLRLRGWYINADDAAPYNFGTPVTGHTVLTAVWEADITFDIKGGLGPGPATLPVIEGHTVELAAVPGASAQDMVKEGYSFVSWCTDAKSLEMVSSVTVTGPTTLYARWKKEEDINVIFQMAWHGSNYWAEDAYYEVSVPYNAKIPQPPDPTYLWDNTKWINDLRPFSCWVDVRKVAPDWVYPHPVDSSIALSDGEGEAAPAWVWDFNTRLTDFEFTYDFEAGGVGTWTFTLGGWYH